MESTQALCPDILLKFNYEDMTNLFIDQGLEFNLQYLPSTPWISRSYCMVQEFNYEEAYYHNYYIWSEKLTMNSKDSWEMSKIYKWARDNGQTSLGVRLNFLL